MSTFSIGQGYDRRTVVCFKSDLIRYLILSFVIKTQVLFVHLNKIYYWRDFKLNGVQSSNKTESRTCNSNMGVEGPLTSIENSKQKPGNWFILQQQMFYLIT